MGDDSNEACSWCGRALDPDDSWLLAAPTSDSGAAFCRLEHLVPWTIRGPRWREGAPAVPSSERAELVLLRRRAGNVSAEGFETIEALAAWAKAGGPWAR